MEGASRAQGSQSTSQFEKFTGTIRFFSRLNSKKYSETFIIGGNKWQILIFPKGNTVDCLSLYLSIPDAESLPNGWRRYVTFSLALVDQKHGLNTVRRETVHCFDARQTDWGYTSFMPLTELYDRKKGFLVNDTCIIEAEIAVPRNVEYQSRDTKKETGLVGLKNQEGTCYLNSFLQTLYNIPYLRMVVGCIPICDNDVASQHIYHALQNLFYELQSSDNAVDPQKLIEVFGWCTYNSFPQHDLQNFFCVLYENLEENMKGTVTEGTIQWLFQGHCRYFIQGINANWKSSRRESFYDLQLNVKGSNNVYDALDKYFEAEYHRGDNTFHVELPGLQDVKNDIPIVDFPPVLQLHLKRFEYDLKRDSIIKLNDPFEFPLQLDLDRENGKYILPEDKRNKCNLYSLHSVLVHCGGVLEGNYFSFIRPYLSDQWFKFDNEHVSRVDAKQALEDQFGGKEPSNAYMLVYICNNDKENLFGNSTSKDISSGGRATIENKVNKKIEAWLHPHIIVKVARDEDLMQQIGRVTHLDLLDFNQVKSFHVQKQMPFREFKEKVAQDVGVPVKYQRYWFWEERRDNTNRPRLLLTHHEERQTIGQLGGVLSKSYNTELKLLLEIELGEDLQPTSLPSKLKEDILLLFKLYDPKREELRYVGRLFVKYQSKPIDILTRLNKMAGYAPDEDIELYEGVRFEPNIVCQKINKNLSFQSAQLEDGDVICFQKCLLLQNHLKFRCPDVPSFLERMGNLE